MFPFLREANFEPQIVFEPEIATEIPDVAELAPRLLTERFRIVFFQKVHGPSVETLARQLSAAGISTVYGVCDLVNVAMAEATNTTIVVTEYLRSLYPPALQAKIRVVHDGIERPEVCKTSWRPDRGSRSRPLQAVLVTSVNLHELPVIDAPPEWLEVLIVGRYSRVRHSLQRLREVRWNLAAQRDSRERLSYLRFLTNRRIRCLAWDPVGVYERMRHADIGIIPIEVLPEPQLGAQISGWKVKSENRLTMKMGVGLPVIATPIPAYEPVIEQGRNGYLARSQRDWIECLDALRDPTLRRSIGNEARESVLTKYSMEAQARRLTEVLRDFEG